MLFSSVVFIDYLLLLSGGNPAFLLHDNSKKYKMKIGINIEKLEKLMNTPMDPPPSWAQHWQTQAEHLLFMAHSAKDESDLEELQNVDNEAIKLIEERESKLR